MPPTWKPDGLSTLSPYLIVEGAQEVIGFAKAVLGAAEGRRFDMPDGSIMHAEIQIGDTTVMLGEASGDWPPAPANLHVYVEDVDAAYRRALDAGATAVQEPRRREGDLDRRGGVRDPAGNTWWIATQVGGGGE